MEKTKVALLGAGFIGEIHLESYRRFVPEAEVTAIYSGTERRAEEFARRHGITHWFASVDEIPGARRLGNTGHRTPEFWSRPRGGDGGACW